MASVSRLSRLPMPRSVAVTLALLPFLISFIRDWRGYLFFGEGRALTAAQHRRRAAALRRTMGELGPSFIKGAQVVAMREDIIPAVYAQELRKLQDQVPPFPVAEVRQILQRSLGSSPAQIFDHFNPRPLAAASLGQVHEAILHGQKVAVKVRRPGVVPLVQTDLITVRALLVLLSAFVEENLMRSFNAIIGEYERMINEEMDFRNERRNAARLRKNFANDPKVRIPRFSDRYNTEEVAVIEFIDGIRVDDQAGIAALGVHPDELIDLLIRSYVRMAVVHGFIHADPHPGNLLMDRHGRLVILDFGMALEFPEATRIELLRMVYAVVRNDVDTIVDGFYALDMVDPEINRAVMVDAAQKLLDIQLNTDVTPRQMQVIAQEILDTFYKFPLRLPNQLVYLMRASTLVEGIALSYYPDFISIKRAKPIVKQMLVEIAFQGEKPIGQRLRDGAREIYVTARDLGRLVRRAEREQFRVRIHEADLMEMERFFNSFLRRFLTGLGICTLVLVSALRGPGSMIFLGSAVVFLVLFVTMLVAVPLPKGARRRRNVR